MSEGLPLSSYSRASTVLTLDVHDYALAIKSDVTLHTGREHILAAFTKVRGTSCGSRAD